MSRYILVAVRRCVCACPLRSVGTRSRPRPRWQWAMSGRDPELAVGLAAPGVPILGAVIDEEQEARRGQAFDEAIEAMARLALPPDEERTPMDRLRIGLGSVRFLIIALVVLLLVYSSLTVVPAGHVGVKDFFGAVSDRALAPGINLVVPGTRVIKSSVQTREVKETAAVPTSEGLIVGLTSLSSSVSARTRPRVSTRRSAVTSRRLSSIPSSSQSSATSPPSTRRSSSTRPPARWWSRTC